MLRVVRAAIALLKVPNDLAMDGELQKSAQDQRKMFCLPPQRDEGDELKPEDLPPSLREAVFGLDKSE